MKNSGPGTHHIERSGHRLDISFNPLLVPFHQGCVPAGTGQLPGLIHGQLREQRDLPAASFDGNGHLQPVGKRLLSLQSQLAQIKKNRPLPDDRVGNQPDVPKKGVLAHHTGSQSHPGQTRRKGNPTDLHRPVESRQQDRAGEVAPDYPLGIEADSHPDLLPVPGGVSLLGESFNLGGGKRLEAGLGGKEPRSSQEGKLRPGLPNSLDQLRAGLGRVERLQEIQFFYCRTSTRGSAGYSRVSLVAACLSMTIVALGCSWTMVAGTIAVIGPSQVR